jgi:serine/threonine-protein kinase RsbW
MIVGSEETVHLAFDAEPQNVARARHAVADLATQIGMVEPALGDAKLVVSEACSNVVRHAYPDDPGRFEVEACRCEDGLEIVVRDFGVGVRPRFAPDPGGSLRLGLGLISILSSHYEILGRDGGGTEIRMAVPFN